MNTIPLEEAIAQLCEGHRKLNIYTDSTCSGAWLTISPEDPDEMHPLEVSTETIAINESDNAKTIHESPRSFIDKTEAISIRAHAALLAHFYNHGPELVEALSNALEMLKAWPESSIPPGSLKEAVVLETRSKVASILSKVSTVQLP